MRRFDFQCAGKDLAFTLPSIQVSEGRYAAKNNENCFLVFNLVP